MTPDEKRGYSKGYAAGLRRKKAQQEREHHQRAKDANWNRAFLAALPAAMLAEGWKRGGTPIHNITSRTKLASEFADEATKYMRTSR